MGGAQFFRHSFLQWYEEYEGNVLNKFVKNAKFCYLHLHFVVCIFVDIACSRVPKSTHIGKHRLLSTAHKSKQFFSSLCSFDVFICILCAQTGSRPVWQIWSSFVFEWQMILTISYQPHFLSRMLGIDTAKTQNAHSNCIVYYVKVEYGETNR